MLITNEGVNKLGEIKCFLCPKPIEKLPYLSFIGNNGEHIYFHLICGEVIGGAMLRECWEYYKNQADWAMGKRN